jgi:rieske iron-sulfur protein
MSRALAAADRISAGINTVQWRRAMPARKIAACSETSGGMMRGEDNETTQGCACSARQTRREVLALASAVGIEIAAGVAPASADPADERPKPGDHLVPIEGSEPPRPLTPADVPKMPLLAWPMDPKDGVVRNGSRLNRVLLVALDPATLEGPTRDRAAGGIVAYSAICTHQGCEVTRWVADSDLLECPCHESRYNPRDGAAVIDGPAPRPLPALPLAVADGKLVVAKPFIGRPGVIPT